MTLETMPHIREPAAKAAPAAQTPEPPSRGAFEAQRHRRAIGRASDRPIRVTARKVSSAKRETEYRTDRRCGKCRAQWRHSWLQTQRYRENFRRRSIHKVLRHDPALAKYAVADNPDQHHPFDHVQQIPTQAIDRNIGYQIFVWENEERVNHHPPAEQDEDDSEY